jgi:hypothetical protein
MKETLYACGGCKAVVRHPVCAALELERFEDQCPGCRRWNKFVRVGLAVEQPDKLVFGQKRIAA